MYDAIIIGSGPGGYPAAIRISQMGGKACIIEKAELGGTCTNIGCIPTKALVANAHLIEKIKQAARFGIDIPNYSVDFTRVMQRMKQVVKASNLGITGLLKSYNVDVIKGEGKIISPGKVSVNSQTIDARNIIIATGSVPIVPQGITIDGNTVITSDHIFSMQSLPKEMAVIGGGFIGLEIASVLNTLGTKVTIIEMLPNILNNLDRDIIEELTKQMKRKGIDILTNHKFLEIRGSTVKVQNLTDNNISTISAEKILMAIGRRANYSLQEMDALGIKYEKKGIIVDKHMRTSAPGIYAIGDVTGLWQLAHVAAVQGEVAAENIMGHSFEIDYSVIPSCIFTAPEISTVGLAEKDVIAPVIGKFPFAANGKARSMSEIEGFVKVIVKDNRLAGVHIIGPNASDLIEEAALAMRNNLALDQLLHTIHPHPTLCEAFKGAIEDAAGRAIDLPKKSM